MQYAGSVGKGADDLRQELRRLLDHIGNGTAGPPGEDLPKFLHLFEHYLREAESERRETRWRLKHLGDGQRSLDARLVRLEHSRVFRCLRWAGNLLRNSKRRAGQAILHSPLHPLYLKIFPTHRKPDLYSLWRQRQALFTPPLEWYRRQADAFSHRPLFSVLLPIHNPNREWLEAAVDSVLCQSYPSWELCACDDASTQGWIVEYFLRKAQEDARIRFLRSERRLGISGALNRAGELTRGDFVGLLDQDDLLSPHALYYVTEALQHSKPDLIYSDEEQISQHGHSLRPIFKPTWSPDLLTSCMYLGHFLVVSRAALDRVGWFRGEFDTSQDYELALRVTDGSAAVRHVPRILYHWRQHPGSTCGDPVAKPGAHEAGRRALEQAMARRGWQARVEDGPSPGFYRVSRDIIGQPTASLIICSQRTRFLRASIRAIQRITSYPHRQLVVVHHKVGNAAAMDRLLKGIPCLPVPYDGPFHFSLMNNTGARAASGEILVFLNDDVQPLVPGWLTALIAQVQRPEVGVAGAKLLYPSGAIQHAGVVIGILDGAAHPQRDSYGTGYWDWIDTTRNVTAVTGACLAVRREVFEDLGGFDLSFPSSYNDVDFCLRVRQAGYEVIYEPACLLRHHEAGSRSPLIGYDERERFYQRWRDRLEASDPFYNPNLARTSEDASLNWETPISL